MRPKVDCEVGLLVCYFFFYAVFEVFFAEQSFDFWKLERNSLWNGLSGVSAVKDILLRHLCKKIDYCWSRILHLVYESVVYELIFVSVKHHFLQNMIDHIHRIIGSIPYFPFLILLEHIVNVHLLLFSKKLVLRLL